MPSVLTLDLGTSCGWTLYAGGKLKRGTADFSPLAHWGDGMRFWMFKRFLVSAKHAAGGELDYVLWEEVMGHGTKGTGGFRAAHIYGAFWGILTYWCEYHEIRYEGVHPATLKKAVAGHGHATKSAVMAAVEAYYGFKPNGHDEGDALALQIYFHRVLWPQLQDL